MEENKVVDHPKCGGLCISNIQKMGNDFVENLAGIMDPFVQVTLLPPPQLKQPEVHKTESMNNKGSNPKFYNDSGSNILNFKYKARQVTSKEISDGKKDIRYSFPVPEYAVTYIKSEPRLKIAVLDNNLMSSSLIGVQWVPIEEFLQNPNKKFNMTLSLLSEADVTCDSEFSGFLDIGITFIPSQPVPDSPPVNPFSVSGIIQVEVKEGRDLRNILQPPVLSKSLIFFRKAVFAVLIYLALGVIVFTQIEEYNIRESLYLSVVTLTTVGYGDKSIETNSGKMIVCFLSILAISLIAVALNMVSTIFVDRFNRSKSAAIIESYSGGYCNTQGMTGTHKFILVSLILMTVTVGIGCTFYCWFPGEELSLLDTIYFGCVTMSTVGYGDIHPKTWQGELFAIFWVIAAVLVTGQAMTTITNSYFSRSSAALEKNMIDTALSFPEQIWEFDQISFDKEITQGEFLGIMLVRLGKVELPIIRQILKRFEELDEDKNGVLTKNDLVLKAERLDREHKHISEVPEIAIIPGTINLDNSIPEDKSYDVQPPDVKIPDMLDVNESNYSPIESTSTPGDLQIVSASI